ncbi:post-PEP-CTERM-1 domain-containing protein [Agarilytica rhodophyticola]|uniref:post-PEP-CTERM-1 domain-containing protein n=1 Tax=Agarilytica rhodophyticola TaxID=1737490 RepID=UPI000B3455B2|nr:hypothetical protein [Agarilytica rhodophyticola]
MKTIYSIASSSILALMLMSINQVNATETHTHTQKSSAATSAALKVVRDKETGQLRAPTAEEAAAMNRQEFSSQQLNMQNNSALSEVAGQMQHHANGVSSMVLDPSKFQSIYGKKNKKGSLVIQHGDHKIENNNSALPER